MWANSTRILRISGNAYNFDEWIHIEKNLYARKYDEFTETVLLTCSIKCFCSRGTNCSDWLFTFENFFINHCLMLWNKLSSAVTSK
jgi:hypothetical protein